VITLDLMECPKCKHTDEPVISYRWSNMECAHQWLEHFHVRCRRCDYQTALPVEK